MITVDLHGGICENCSKRVIHRHHRNVRSGACEDTLLFCRKCDEGWQCDECVEESALRFYEFVHGGSADDLAEEAMITAIFAIEFADKFNYWLHEEPAKVQP